MRVKTIFQWSSKFEGLNTKNLSFIFSQKLLTELGEFESFDKTTGISTFAGFGFNLKLSKVMHVIYLAPNSLCHEKQEMAQK